MRVSDVLGSMRSLRIRYESDLTPATVHEFTVVAPVVETLHFFDQYYGRNGERRFFNHVHAGVNNEVFRLKPFSRLDLPILQQLFRPRRILCGREPPSATSLNLSE